MRWFLLGLLMLAYAETGWTADPDVYPPDQLTPFLGLDDTTASSRVQRGRASAIQNVTIGLSADARKRDGLAVIGETLDEPGEAFCVVQGLTYAQFAGGTSRILTICGQHVRYLSGSDFIDIPPVSNPNITAGQNNQFVFTTALSQLIATNDVNAPLQWSGSATEPITGVTFTGLTNAIASARTTTFFQNYLLFGNTVEGGTRFPTRVRWPNVGTINTWTNADFVDVDAPAGQELNCMGQLFGDVYLGFTSSLYKMSLVGGSGTFAFTKVSSEVGCVAKGSMQQVTLGNSTGLLFLDAKKRVYFFNGTVLLETSQLIHTVLNGVNGARLRYAVSAVDGEHYYLCLSNGGSTTNNLCLDFNYLLGEWSRLSFVSIGVNAMARVTDSDTDSQVYLGTHDSFVYQLNNNTNDNDVGGAGGVLESTSRFESRHASSLQVLYDSDASFTVSGLIGAPIEFTGGTASGLVGMVVDNTTTGLVVASDFSTTPDATTAYEVGRINAYYTTRWDDFGEPARIKHAGELFLVADADIGSTLDVAYATDFLSTTATPTASLTPSAGSLWGTAIWGTAVWGGGDTLMVRVKLEDDGRWWRFIFTEDDRDENFRAHGWQVLYWKGDNF